MAYGHCYDAWNHTASLMSMLAAIHTDPKSGHTPNVADYHPFLDQPELPKASPEFVKSLFSRAMQQESA